MFYWRGNFRFVFFLFGFFWGYGNLNISCFFFLNSWWDFCIIIFNGCSFFRNFIFNFLFLWGFRYFNFWFFFFLHSYRDIYFIIFIWFILYNWFVDYGSFLFIRFVLISFRNLFLFLFFYFWDNFLLFTLIFLLINLKIYWI